MISKRLLFLAVLSATTAAWGSGRKPDSPSDTRTQSTPSETTPVPEPTPAVVPPTSIPKGETPPPVYLAELPNPNDFVLFANGGWDGNWYVGYNSCWISKLPPAPPGNYVRAFIGAKLGRMKTEPIPGKPSWERRPIRGEINIAVAQEPLWPQSHRFMLTKTEEIPIEADPENAVEGVGESRWFWVEIPLRFVSSEKENFIALFSPSEALVDARHAPILAAGWGESRDNTWLNSAAKGEPPFNAEEALKTAVTYFEPSLAIKLVPENALAVDVRLLNPPVGEPLLDKKLVLSAVVNGNGIESAWIEFSTDTRNWQSAGTRAWGPPYTFTVKPDGLQEGRNFLRVAAIDQWGNRGMSESAAVRIAPPTPPSKKKQK